MSKMIIEQEETALDYGFTGVIAIIEHPKHGRLFISDGYGGEDTLKGGMVRFEHGIICSVKKTDTLESLFKTCGVGIDSTSDYGRMSNGYDLERPVLNFTGKQVANIAASAGL